MDLRELYIDIKLCRAQTKTNNNLIKIALRFLLGYY